MYGSLTFAQSFVLMPLKLIVPDAFGPLGVVMGRMNAEKKSSDSGQSMVIEHQHSSGLRLIMK